MKISYRTDKDTEYGNITEYHHIKDATVIECDTDTNYTYAFISKSYETDVPDTFLLYIGDVCVKFPVTMVDTVIKNVKLVMEKYDNDLHEEQLADERSTDAE
tara:strand:+ start:2352 stop:2657 length:306 start_codon:yes stop_codon:yes gene_type:complete